jgi:membrane-bound lytic murein transglycosylase D
MSAVLGWFVATQVLLAASLGLARLVGTPARPAAAVRSGRILFVAALLAPLVAAVAPAVAPAGFAGFAAPPAQVWSGSAGVLLQVGSASPFGVALPRAVPLDTLANALAVAVLGAIAIGLVGVVPLAVRLRSALRGAVPVRHIGRVRVLVAPAARSPFAALLPGAAVVVLDPDTYADPAQRTLAVLHELQHHRARDPGWAWALVLAAPLGVGLPWMRGWRRWLSDLEEIACDRALVDRRRLPARAYAEGLLRAAERAPLLPNRRAPGRGPTPSLLHRRISMLLSPPARVPRRLPLVAALCLLGGVALAADGSVVDHRVSRAAVATAATSAAAATTFPIVVNDQVFAQLDRLAGTPDGRRYLTAALDRRPGSAALVEGALLAAGLARELAAIPLVESGYANLGAPGVTGPSLAPGIPGRGLWMFIPATARAYGLRVDDTSDDRLDPARETAAAVHLLGDLHTSFGEWPLAIAAYNQGEKAVRAAIRAEGTRDPWVLAQRGALNDYLALVMATVLILDDPTLAE